MQEFPKTINIVGPQGAGKTTIAHQLTKGKKSVWLDPSFTEKKYPYKDVNSLTEFIVLDGLNLGNKAVLSRVKALASSKHLFLRKTDAIIRIETPTILITSTGQLFETSRPNLEVITAVHKM